MTAFDKTMEHASDTAKNLAKNAKGSVVEIETIPKASRAAAAGMKLLSVAMNLVDTVIISTLLAGITKMIGASEEMSQQAAEATKKYKEQSSSIDEYKDKIIELRTSLDTENLTYADAKDKRSQLIEIQKQLIDTYGNEAKGIDLVNGSLDTQTEKLDKLNKQKRQEWGNDVNKLSTGQKWQKWGGFVGLTALSILKPQEWFTNKTAVDWLNNFDNTTNIERITKKVENFSKTIKFGSIGDDLKNQLESYNGVSFDGLKMTISGDAKTVAETVSQIQTDVIGSRKDLQWLNQDLKDVYNSAKKIVDENWDTYNTALEIQILDDKDGLEYYGKLTEAYETYQDALKDGDETAIANAKENYSKVLSDISNSDMSDSFKKFFENMYPDIADIINEWKFEVNITPKINTNEGGLKDKIESVEGLTTEEILAAFDNNGSGVTKEQWKGITSLNAEAQANGLDLSTFLNQLRDSGYLISQVDKDIDNAIAEAQKLEGDTDWNKYFKDQSIDTQEELDKWNEVTKGCHTATEAMEAWKKATADAADKATSSLSDLEKVSDNIGKISGAYKELSDNGYITIKTIGEVQKATGLSGDEWDEYESKLLNAKKGSAEFNEVMSELTYKMIDNQISVGDLTNATDEEIAAIESKIEATLRENGVTNASAVAHDYLSYAKARSSAQSTALALATNAESVNLAAEAAQCGLTEAQFKNLIIQQILFNQTNLDVSQKLTALQQLGLYANWTAEQLAKVSSTTITYSDGKWWVNSYGEDADGNGEKDYLGSEEYKGYQPAFNPEDFKVTAPKFSGVSSGSGSGGSGKSGDDDAKKAAEDAKKAEEERIKKELEALKAGLDMRQKLLDKYKESVDLTDFGLDLAEETDFSLRIDLLNNKMSQLTSYGKAMRTEFDRVASIIPETADQADALASHLESLGSDMRSNITALRETQVAMEQLKIDSIVSIGEDYLGDLSRELSNMEQRIEMLNKDNSQDYEYTNQILNMEMFLPTT